MFGWGGGELKVQSTQEVKLEMCWGQGKINLLSECKSLCFLSPSLSFPTSKKEEASLATLRAIQSSGSKQISQPGSVKGSQH